MSDNSTSTSANMLAAVRAAGANLDVAVANMMESVYKPDIRVISQSYRDDEVGGGVDRFALVQGVWISTYPGMRMMLIDDATECSVCEEDCRATRVLCEAKESVICPRHKHNYSETVTVISGELIEHEPGSSVHALRRASDRIHYAGGQWHQPEVRGLIMVCWRPPLARIQTPHDASRFGPDS